MPRPMASDPTLSMAPPDDYIGADRDETTIVVPAQRRRRWRWLRRLALVLLVLVVLLVAAGGVLYESPPLLESAGTMLLGTQPGVVAWNGTDPLNILVMGVDQRAAETPHSDTMIVLRVDPASHNVKMLSIPRDLYVNIPNYNYYKINAAYSNGYNAVFGTQGIQAAQVLGAQFAQLVVESALHVPINYYAVLKFSGFKNMVDALGGITVCVPRELYDTQYPNDTGYGMHTIDIKAGCQKMDGATALVYARERHANPQGDLGRNQQQQALLDSMEKQLLSPGTLLRLPGVLSAIDGAIVTNMPRGMLPELGLLLGRARGAQTRHSYINADGGYVTETLIDGQDVLAPNWPKINALVASLFTDPALRAENATVQVQNGQHSAGLAALYTTILQGMGFNTVAPADATKNTYAQDQVIVNQDRPGAGYTARKLAQILQASVSNRHLGAGQPQIVAIIGSNAAEGS